MDSWDILFERELSVRINKKLAAKQEQIASGRAKTFDDYRYRCGEIAALSDVLKDIHEVRDIALGKTDGKEN